MIKKFIASLLIVTTLGYFNSSEAWIAQKAATVNLTGGQVLLTNIAQGVANSSDRYHPVGWATTTTVSITDSILYTIVPVSGSITGMIARMNTSPSPGTMALTLYKNGSSTGLTCTITSVSPCSSSTSVSIAAGDYLSWQSHPSGVPSTGRVTISIIFTPTTLNDTVIFAEAQALSNSTAQAVMPFSNFSPAIVSSRRYNTLPDGGTIDKFYVISNAPGTGTNYAYTVDKNGVTTALTTSIADTAVSNSDTTHSFTVAGSSGASCVSASVPGDCAAGDDLQFQAVPTSTPASATAAFGARYIPTTTGSYPLIASRLIDNTAAVEYYSPVASSSGNTTESSEQIVSHAQIITKIAVKLEFAPGSGKSRVYTLRKNGVDTALSCTISNTALACSNTGTITVNDNDLLSTSMTPSGTPTTTFAAVSYLAHR